MLGPSRIRFKASLEDRPGAMEFIVIHNKPRVELNQDEEPVDRPVDIAVCAAEEVRFASANGPVDRDDAGSPMSVCLSDLRQGLGHHAFMSLSPRTQC